MVNMIGIITNKFWVMSIFYSMTVMIMVILQCTKQKR
jgi:hypothetical protein